MKHIYILTLSVLLLLQIFSVVHAQTQQIPQNAQAPQPCSRQYSEARLCFFGMTDLRQTINRLLGAVGAMVGTLAILMVVLSGARMIFAGADPEQIKKGKQGLKYALGGFAISILSFVIVTSVEFFIGRVRTGVGGGTDTPVVTNPLFSGSFVSFITQTILPNFFAILGLFAILMIILNGFRYVMSAGNEEMAKKGKEGLTWAVIGFIIVLLAYVLVSATNRLLGGS